MSGSPRVIKKYANRKLYDTVDRSYVTVAVVQELVDRGVEVEIIDQVSGEDITETVLGRSGTTHRGADEPVAVQVRGQLTNLLKNSLTLPLELSQRARERLSTPEAAVTAAEFAELRDRVEDLAGEVARLSGITKDAPVAAARD